MHTDFVLVDHTGRIPDAEMQAVAAALAIQATEHFGLPAPDGYDTGTVEVRVQTPQTPPKPHEWVIGLFAHPDQPGALGYHDVTRVNQPLIKIFPFLSSQPWSITASHEVLEALADPLLRMSVQDNEGTFWAFEVCDAVEDDTYKIGDVEVSNFCLPSWFEPPAETRGEKYDYLGLCTHDHEVREGGYAQKWDAAKGWDQIGLRREHRLAYARKTVSRAARRAARCFLPLHESDKAVAQ